MTPQQKLDLIGKAYTSMPKDDKTIMVLNEKIITDEDMRTAILDIQQEIDADFELSYEIMADACAILAEKTLAGNDRDSLTGDDLDFLTDADSNANVYTSTQLSYLSNNNEGEISDLMKDEAITSIAQACSVWYSRKVAEGCEALKSYILA